MIREIASNKDITSDMRDKLLTKLGDIGVTLEDSKTLSQATLNKMDDVLDNVGEKMTIIILN